MRVQQFRAQVSADSRGRAVIVVPFDPDEAWGVKAVHHVNGTVNGCQRPGQRLPLASTATAGRATWPSPTAYRATRRSYSALMRATVAASCRAITTPLEPTRDKGTSSHQRSGVIRCSHLSSRAVASVKPVPMSRASKALALEVQPENPLASNNLAYVMLQQGGNVDVAFAMAQTARRQLPDNPNAADTLGWAFYHKNVYTSAIGLFKEAVKKEPDNALFNYHLGLAYAKSGKAALARQQLDRVVKIKPNFPEVEELRKAVAEAKGSGLGAYTVTE